MAVPRPWPFGGMATCLAKIIQGNQNLETPQVLSFRNGLTLRKRDGWHRITRTMYPILASKVGDGGTPIIAFREDPLAKSVSELREDAAERKETSRRKKKAAAAKEASVHPALAAAQTDDPEEVAELAAAEPPEEDEMPSRLSTASFDDDEEESSSPPKKRGRRRSVKLRKG